MASHKLRKAIAAVKDQTSIGLAKVGSKATISDLEVAIVKVTRHEEHPPDERHIREILNLTAYSRTFVSCCISMIAKRLNKTKNWVVALKGLMLVWRFLVQGNTAFEQEIFATRRERRLLNMSDFRDASGQSDAWHYSAFVCTYARYLDEYLEFRMHGQREEHKGYGSHQIEDEESGGSSNLKGTTAKSSRLTEMKIDAIFSQLHHLMQLLERFLACRPAGAAKDNRLVQVALHPIVVQSFQLYHNSTKILAELIDRFMELQTSNMVRAHEILSRVAKQYDELDALYGWCKTAGISCSTDYPNVEKLSQQKLHMMNDFIREKSTSTKRLEPRSLPVREAKPKQETYSSTSSPPPEEIKEEITKGRGENKETKDAQKVLHLTNVGVNKTALPLSDPGQSKTAPQTVAATPWEAFKELSGGFDKLILNTAYQQGPMPKTTTPFHIPGPVSASSAALGSASRSVRLALQPPRTDGRDTSSSMDTNPFFASQAVALLAHEQLMWQQYPRDGLPGQIGLAKVQHPYPFNIWGYSGTY